MKHPVFAVDLARVDRTLLSDAFDVPTLLTLVLILLLPLGLKLPVWVGHSCPTPLTLRLILLLLLGVEVARVGRNTLVRRL